VLNSKRGYRIIPHCSLSCFAFRWTFVKSIQAFPEVCIVAQIRIGTPEWCMFVEKEAPLWPRTPKIGAPLQNKLVRK